MNIVQAQVEGGYQDHWHVALKRQSGKIERIGSCLLATEAAAALAGEARARRADKVDESGWPVSPFGTVVYAFQRAYEPIGSDCPFR